MRYCLIIAFCILSVEKIYCQATDFVELIFRDKNNLKITETFHTYPTKIYLLEESIAWDRDRFVVNKQSRRHAEAKDPYIFSDSSINRLFSEAEKEHFVAKLTDTSRTRLKTTGKTVHLVHSAVNIKGYLFTMTKPVYNSDSTYAFIDLHVYFKGNRTSDFDQAYYGSVLFLFEHSLKEGWIIIKQLEEIVL